MIEEFTGAPSFEEGSVVKVKDDVLTAPGDKIKAGGIYQVLYVDKNQDMFYLGPTTMHPDDVKQFNPNTYDPGRGPYQDVIVVGKSEIEPPPASKLN